MNFGGFLDSNSVGTVGSGAKIVADIPYTDSSRNNINVNGTTTTTTTNMPTSAAISQPRLATQPLSKSMFSSPGLSLALQTSLEGQGEVGGRMAENNYEGNTINIGRRNRDEEHEISRSGSDNMEGASGDDQDAADKPPRKKRYHRHTPQQIQELESYTYY